MDHCYEPPRYANPLSAFLLTLLLLYCLRWRFENTTVPPEYPLPYVQIKRVSAKSPPTSVYLSYLHFSPRTVFISHLSCVELVV